MQSGDKFGRRVEGNHVLSSLLDSWENLVVATEKLDEMPPFERVKIKFLGEGARKEVKLEETEAVYTLTHKAEQQ